MRKDIETLMSKLEKTVDSGMPTALPGVLREMLVMFESLKEMLPKMNAAERQEVFKQMHVFHNFLQEQLKNLSTKTGLSQEQLLRFSENPDNFSKEQWSLLTEVKEKMQEQSQELKEVMKSIPGPFFSSPDKFLEETSPPRKAIVTPIPSGTSVKKGHRVKKEIRRA